MKPIFSGEAMLRRITEHELVFVLDDPAMIKNRTIIDGRCGQRFAMVLVELDDEGRAIAEVPMDPLLEWGTLQATNRQIDSLPPTGWHRSVQCAALCRDPGYGWFLYETTRGQLVPLPRVKVDDAAVMARELFNIDSRSKLDSHEMIGVWEAHLEDVRGWIKRKKAARR